MLVPGFFPAQLICKRLDPEASKYAALFNHKTYREQDAEIEFFLYLSERIHLNLNKWALQARIHVALVPAL